MGKLRHLANPVSHFQSTPWNKFLTKVNFSE